MNIEINQPEFWQDYELIDTGNFEKLERFGTITLIRPEPQAVWQAFLSENEWKKKANALFEQQGSHAGIWHTFQANVPDNWRLKYTSHAFKLTFKLALTAFKHIGLFPEQAANWEFVFHQCKRIGGHPNVLNLFAYTGGASLAAAAAGAKVTHVDSVKQVIHWANENAEMNDIQTIRWIVEDALKFVQREARRGAKYQGILLDPPSFGHGSKGERWKLEEKIDELIRETAKILAPEQNFYVFNCYSVGFSTVILQRLLQSHFHAKLLKDMELIELCIQESASKRFFPTGVVARFWN